MKTISDQDYMNRCVNLGLLGSGFTAPNPLVGAVLVHENRIIGEGYHQRWGQAHAEVNCIDSVAPADRGHIPESTLYVSLEPCVHQGKTPPCADRIIREQIPRVVIGCRDPFKGVNGKGIERLQLAGVSVVLGVGESECREMNRRFFRFHEERRPFIILKWAQTANGMMGLADRSRLYISNELTNRLVHRWRSEEAAILIGTNTALYDNPVLSNRHWPGPSPLRLVLDRGLRLPPDLKLLSDGASTVILNEKKQGREGVLQFEKLEPDENLARAITATLYRLKILSVLIEGGPRLIQSFVDEGIWDEARIISNASILQSPGVPAPRPQDGMLVSSEQYLDDRVDYYRHLPS